MTKTYFKATDTEGRDFHTGTVDYAGHLASGKPLKRLTSDDGVYECCTDTVYHASDTPSETLIGGKFPCRLFEITGRPVAQSGRKYGFRSLRVVREVPAWQALGPNGEQVVALIAQAAGATPDQITRLDAARDAVWGAARDAARDAALALVVKDLVTDTQFDALYGPWASVFGPPQ